MENYEIKIKSFEGPFDLLLFFIERDELDIHDIPISKITDDFLHYIQELNALNIEVASEFILMASTLMRIKAKTLLPRPGLEEEDAEEMKKDLMQKLILYKKFKDICEQLKPLEEKKLQLYRRGNITSELSAIAKGNSTVEEELSSLTLYRLMMVYENRMDRYLERRKEVKHTIVRYPYTIEQQKKTIKELIKINEKLDFATIARQSENKVQFVYTFLAILEMLQQQLLAIETGIGYNNFSVRKKLS